MATKKVPEAKLVLTPQEQEAKIAELTAQVRQAAPAGRMDEVLRGMKSGAMKAAFKKLVKIMADPIKEKIVPALKGVFPETEMLEPAIELAVGFILMLGTAELVSWASSMLPGDKSGEMAERGKLLGSWMREYAGEEAGAQLFEVATMILPLILAQFSEISTPDLKFVLGKDEEAQPAEIEKEEDQVVTA